jgi:peptidyl-prolyl cis-trans isomerase C
MPAPQGPSFPRYGRSILRGMFGQPFVDALWAAPVGEWSGPVESSHGWHYVRPAEQLPETRLAFDVVRDQAENDYLVAVISQAVERHVTRRRFRIDTHRAVRYTSQICWASRSEPNPLPTRRPSKP